MRAGDWAAWRPVIAGAAIAAVIFAGWAAAGGLGWVLFITAARRRAARARRAGRPIPPRWYT